MEASGRFRVRGGPGEMEHVHLHVLSPWDRGPSYWSGSTRRTSDLLGGDRPERRPRAARDSNPLLIAKESTAALRRHGGRPRPGVPHARSPCCTGRRARLLHVQTTPTPWYKDGDGHGGRTAPKSGQTAAAFSRSTPPPARTVTGVWTTTARPRTGGGTSKADGASTPCITTIPYVAEHQLERNADGSVEERIVVSQDMPDRAAAAKPHN